MARRPLRPQRHDSAPELLDLTIEAIGAQGDGVARGDGAEVFVPYTMPGDRVLARRIAPHHALPVTWQTRAAAHHKPPCPHFGACGGCALQHLGPDDYDAWKRRQLETALARRGFSDIAIAPTARTEPGTRRRADLGVARHGDSITVGFHAYKSRELINLTACHVLHPQIVALLPALRALCRTFLRDRQTADLLVTRLDSGMDLLISHDHALDRAQRETIAAFADANDLVRVAWRRASETPEIVMQRRPSLATFAGTAVEVPPGAFLQASEAGEAAIVGAVTAATAGAKRVADLYAGCGTITFPLAQQSRVHAVEGAPPLADAIGAAARRSGQAGRISVERRDLSRRPLLADELGAFDAVVFDPPRDGAAAQAAEIARSGVPVVVGVSCNPATFARDARILVDGGYRLAQVTPIDQFLWSPHLELVGVFRR
jgi:23S rRNA (uracil1939-C5)-methyltransferase